VLAVTERRVRIGRAVQTGSSTARSFVLLPGAQICATRCDHARHGAARLEGANKHYAPGPRSLIGPRRRAAGRADGSLPADTIGGSCARSRRN
jgi:hypothetical protein